MEENINLIFMKITI